MNNDENKTMHPVELTDEEMEQASGGSQAQEQAKEWKEAAKAEGREVGPYGCPQCQERALYGKSKGKVRDDWRDYLFDAKCYNCEYETEQFNLTFLGV